MFLLGIPVQLILRRKSTEEHWFCLIVRDSFLEFMFNAPSDSDGDLPLDIWHFWEILWILTGLPQMMDNDHAVPLDWKCFSIWGDLLVEKVFVHWIFIVRISLLFKQIVICNQCHFKSAQAYVCLEIFGKCIFSKTSNFVKYDVNSGFLRAFRSQDTFCNSMLSN